MLLFALFPPEARRDLGAIAPPHNWSHNRLDKNKAKGFANVHVDEWRRTLSPLGPRGLAETVKMTKSDSFLDSRSRSPRISGSELDSLGLASSLRSRRLYSGSARSARHHTVQCLLVRVSAQLDRIQLYRRWPMSLSPCLSLSGSTVLIASHLR